MPSDTGRITIRLPSEYIEQLEKLVKNGEYATLSDAIRVAIKNLLDQRFAPQHLERRSVDLPKSTIAGLEHLVDAGDAIDVSDAIRTAVREYIRHRLEKKEG
jgi:Arc/MetJ-type ribon-helix-helix transcriptional regulator